MTYEKSGNVKKLLLLMMLPLVTVAPPAVSSSDIYLAELAVGEGVRVGALTNITARPGYDNQPAFGEGGWFYFVSADTGQSDVYRYALTSGRTTRVTDTPESEYSPTPRPDGSFSTVRVEVDGTQRLWRINGDEASVVFADIDSVGYHTWVGDEAVAMFIVGEPHYLIVADVATGDWRVAAMNVERDLHTHANNVVSFMQNGAEGMMVSRLNTMSMSASPWFVPVAKSQDTAWLPDGRVLMADSVHVYVADPSAAVVEWKPVYEHGLSGVTRMKVDPTASWIAVVAADESSEE